MSEPSVIQQLFDVLVSRKTDPQQNSYTCKLLNSGHEKIAAKIREEAEEVIEAATEEGQEGRDHLTCEAADLTYHLLVMLVHGDVEWKGVEAELARRFGVSGLDEKAARGKDGT